MKKCEVPQPMLVEAEDMNDILVAIKYSNGLSKEQVFYGTRDIFQRLGNVITRGDKVALKFDFGYLVTMVMSLYQNNTHTHTHTHTKS